MPVFIRNFTAKGLGPISKIDLNFKKLNVIFGPNDAGKTYLTEGIMKCLFKMKKGKLRETTGSMKTLVEGLQETPTSFTQTGKKFEDFIIDSIPGLPPDFSKLLVVKSAEVDFCEGDSEKDILMKYLSGKETIRKIENNLKTNLDVQIENNEIVGRNAGDISSRKDLQQKINSIESSLTKLDNDYICGQRKILDDQYNEAKTKLEQMEATKKHHAYSLSQEITTLGNQKNKIDDSKLETLSTEIYSYDQKVIEYQRKKEEEQRAAQASQHFLWVKNASTIYENTLTNIEHKHNQLVFIIPMFFLLGLIGVLSFFNVILGVLGSILMLTIVIIFYLRFSGKMVQDALKNKELTKLNSEFQNRFDEPLKGLPQLKAITEKLQQEQTRRDLLQGQISVDEINLQHNKQNIMETTKILFGNTIGQEQWGVSIQQEKDKKRELTDKISELSKKLTKLGVEETDYISEKTPIDFDAQQYNKLTGEYSKLEQERKNMEEQLQILKLNICQITKDLPTADWNTIIYNLKTERDTFAQEYSFLTAKLLSKVALVQVIKDLDFEEEEKIRQNLDLEVIKNPLFEMTKKYTEVKLEGESLLISDQYGGQYPLRNLSTGSQDQVFLALRLGLSAKLLKQESMFLILDDAFQYADWDRRQHLVSKMIDLAKQGWQIIYFTMDNHIRDLFSEKGKILGDEYQTISLTLQ